MSLFLSDEEYQVVSGQKVTRMIPILGLIRKGYYSYLLQDLLLPTEKDKLYRLFHAETAESKKKIKRITITSQADADILAGRCVKQQKFMYGSSVVNFAGMLPTMELVEWPGNTSLTGLTYASIVKDRYKLDGYVIGTYVIPITYSTSPMSICKTGSTCLEREDICVCNIGNGCCCSTVKCKCQKKCTCDEFEIKLGAKDSIFHMADLEVHEMFHEETRMNLYVHLKYQI